MLLLRRPLVVPVEIRVKRCQASERAPKVTVHSQLSCSFSILSQRIPSGTTAWRISMGRRQVVESVNSALRGAFANLPGILPGPRPGEDDCNCSARLHLGCVQPRPHSQFRAKQAQEKVTPQRRLSATRNLGRHRIGFLPVGRNTRLDLPTSELEKQQGSGARCVARQRCNPNID